MRHLEHPPEWPIYAEPEIRRVTELVRRGRTFDYRHGPELSALEEGFSRLHAGRHALALNSGTSALLAAYHALGVGPGDEVLVPDLTFLATASPLFLLGAVPVLCDSGDPWGNVTAHTLREKIGPRTRAIVVTHLFGRPCAMDEIVTLAREHGLPLIEDCSHAHGSTYRGRRVGTFGDLAVFSIGGLKLVSGGMGGVLLARDRRHHEIACLLSSFQQRSAATVTDPGLRRLADVGLGGNLRISPVAAVLAKAHLDRLDTLVASKARNASRILEPLDLDGIGVPGPGPEHTMGGWYDIVIDVDPERAGFDRDTLLDALCEEGVRARVPRTAPLHRTSVFGGDTAADDVLPYTDEVRRRHLRMTDRDLPAASAAHDRWISLPGTFFNDGKGALVPAYVQALTRVLNNLGRGGAAPRPLPDRPRPTLHVVSPRSLVGWFDHFAGHREGDLVRVIGEDVEDDLTGILDECSSLGDGRTVVVHSSHDTLERDREIADRLILLGHDVSAQSERCAALGADKLAMKRFLRGRGFPTADWTTGTGWSGAPVPVGAPVVVKSRGGTQSRGTRLGRSGEPLSPDEFAEAYHEGCEYSVLVYRGEGRTAVFPPIGKGRNSQTLLPPWKRLRLCPDPGITDAVEEEITRLGVAIAVAADTRGFVEVEYLVGDDGAVRVLEINPRICGTMRIAAMATGVPLFDMHRRPELEGRLTARFWAAEVPHRGAHFAAPDARAFATSRLTVATDRFSGLRGRLLEFGARPDDVSPLPASPALTAPARPL